jgi:hypothetical protein
MRAKAILISAMLLTLRVAAQDTSKTQTQCKFPDGKTIRITHVSQQAGSTELATDETLVTVKGISVPAGDYVVSPSKDAYNSWSLTMRKKAGKGGSSELPLLPMSATTSASPIDKSTVSFDQTGASCTIRWGMEKSNILLSLEFTERNTDIPVLQ